jgi:kynurenine 3-monooxygenase
VEIGVSLNSCQVLIAGAGPSGLAAALLLLDRGWRDIVVVERRATPGEFERGKAFNYQLDGRGQQVLTDVGIDANTLRQYGLPNNSFTQISISADATVKRMSFPALLPGRKTPYWMTRGHLLGMLHKQLESCNQNGAVRVIYGATLDGLEEHEGEMRAAVSDAHGELSHWRPRLLLACDGLGSAVRRQLGALSQKQSGVDANDDAYAMKMHPSPSAELAYKVLNFPANFAINNGDTRVDDHTLAYFFLSSFTEKGRRMALAALPASHADDPRSVNIILHRSHHFWSLKGPHEIGDYLEAAFPQLDIKALVGERELREFSELETGYFPQPQYARRIHFQHGKGADAQDVLLIGDAAHAFPPDLGMGVNTALEEVHLLGELLNESDDDISTASRNFEARRLPENRALVRLVQRTHPYQYNQEPWRLKLWFVKFLCQKKLHQLSRGWIPQPAFVLSQKHLLNFVNMERQAKRADRAFYALLIGLMAGFLAFILR